MSSRAAVMQVPRVALVPSAVGSDSEDAAFLASSYGLTPDDWQQLILDGWLGRRRDGKWSSPRCGLAVPRQNGKNGVLEIRELFGMVGLGEKILHTAHEVKTARKAFARLLSFFDNPRAYPELAGLVQDIRRTNGQEAIFLTNGGSVEFIARSKGSGRGFTVDVLVMDEAQELSDDALAALLPTISAAPTGNPQQILTGTPPAPSMTGEVFTRFRDTGVEGKDPRLCWLEWSCIGDVDPDDRALWHAANPALGGRLSADTIADERAAMDDETFRRERLGMWDDNTDDVDAAINLDAWAAAEDKASTLASVKAFAVETSLDRTRSAIAVAGPSTVDGKTHGEIIDYGRGKAWLVDRCAELDTRHGPAVFVVDSGGPAAGIADALRSSGRNVLTTSTADVGAACAGMVDAVVDATFAWHGPQPELDAAVKGAKRRPVGDGKFAFGRKVSTVDVTPLVAVTLARWAATGSLGDMSPINNVW